MMCHSLGREHLVVRNTGREDRRVLRLSLVEAILAGLSCAPIQLGAFPQRPDEPQEPW